MDGLPDDHEIKQLRDALREFVIRAPSATCFAWLESVDYGGLGLPDDLRSLAELTANNRSDLG